MNRKRLLLALKLVVSLGLVWLLYRRVPLDTISRSLAEIDLRYLPAIAAILLVNTVLSAWKWKIILRADGIRVPLVRLVASYLVGTFFNIFLPSSIGGDAYRIYDVARESGRSAGSFSSVVADRLSGFVALAVLALVASVQAARVASMPLLSLIPLVALFLLLVAIWALFRQTPFRRTMRMFRLDRFKKLNAFAEQCLESFDRYRRTPGVLVRIMGISFAFQLLLVSCVMLMACSLGIRISFVYFCAFVPIICLMEAMPVSVYGIGVRDFGYVFFFGLVGVSKVHTRALALLYLGTNVAYSLFGGVVFAVRVFLGRKREEAAPSRVSMAGRWGIAALVSLLVWAVFSWPLPTHVAAGIPFSSRNTERYHARSMIAGDHLQLLYHFWLAGDMVRGKTRPMYNLYEFNTGNDDQRYEPGAYFVPYSLVYAVISWFGGAAFGWNMAGLVSLIVTYFFTWLLVRRFTRSEWTAALAALVGITFPYRWITLLGGSPTGFAMSLLPVILYGLDVAVRDERPAGGIIAGLAVLLAYCSDLHVFFFGVLAVPCWCVVSFAARPQFEWGRPAAYGRIALALAPAVLLALAAYGVSRTTARELATATLSDGWPWREVGRYSPIRQGLLQWRSLGLSNQIFVGYVVPAILGLGGAIALFSKRSVAPHNRRVFFLLCAGMLVLAALALGTNGPFHGKPLAACRKLIPPYRMVRQTAKVFCLLPTILAIAAAIGLEAIVGAGARRWRRAAAVGLCLALLLEFRLQISASICRLDSKQPAYAAVVADADATGKTPARALVLPLWPGNSHWASIYEYYASLYRLRLVNGYRPAVPKKYQAVFKTFESANQGRLSDGQLDELLERGIRYVLLHEDAFPEQVSPFPVGLTLERLRSHSRLTLLKQHERVWAFEILDKPVSHPPVVPDWKQFPPAWRWELERCGTERAAAVSDEAAEGGGYLALRPGRGKAGVRTRAPVVNAKGLRWVLLARGKGRLGYTVSVDDTPAGSGTRQLDSEQWSWLRIPIETHIEFFTPALTVEATEGSVALDVGLLTAGPVPELPPGKPLTMPAPSLFHAGYTDVTRNRVVFLMDTDPDEVILYAQIPAPERGEYRASIQGVAPEQSGEPAGVFRAVFSGKTLAEKQVGPGVMTGLTFVLPRAGLVRLEFEYARARDVSVGTITLARPEN